MNLVALAIAVSLSAWAGSSTCPDEMVSISSFCIDRFEAPNIEGQRPLVAQSGDEATAWCESRGKRLCTESEWERACSGPQHDPYPYGTVYRKGACNDDQEWRPVNWTLVNRYPDPRAKEHIRYLDQSEPSGSRRTCVSREGVFDLAGNAVEWVVKRKHERFQRGLIGCYWSGCYNMHRPHGTKPGCFGTMNGVHADEARLFRTYEAGFRCCLTQEH